MAASSYDKRFAEYSAKRALETRLDTIAKAERQIDSMARTCARTISEMQKELADILDSVGGDLSKAERLLTSPELQKYRLKYGTLLRRYLGGDEKANELLDLLYKQQMVTRLESLISQIQALGYQLGGTIVAGTAATLNYAAERGYYSVFHAIETGTGKAATWSAINTDKLEAIVNSDWSGKLWSDRIWGHVDNLADTIKDTITKGVLTGENLNDLGAELAGKTNVLKHQAERIVRTETAYVNGAAELKSYKEAQIDDYTIIATLDLKTSAICRNMDGKSFPVDKAETGVNYPPFHPNCRTTTGFFINRDSHYTRTARNPVTGKSESIPGDWNYNKWYEERVKNNPDKTTIKSPIERRNKSIGNPKAISFGGKLKGHQENLLSKLKNEGDTVIVSKRNVSMRDLSALTAHENVEFALFTKQGKRMIIRGDVASVSAMNEAKAKSLNRLGWRWSGHTHVGGDEFDLVPSDGDLKILKMFDQEKTVIYNSVGDWQIARM